MRSSAFVLSILCFIFVLDCSQSFSVFENMNSRNSSDEIIERGFDTARKKKHKLHLILPLVVAALLIKSILFPLAVKAMAVMSSTAVLLSSMSLIISSIVGYVKLAYYKTSARPPPPPPAVKVVYVDRPWAKQSWNQHEEIPPPVPLFKSKYITSEPFVLDDDEETKVIDHYHTFVD